MTAPARLVLIRHAEPHADVHGRVYGRLDIGLSAAGHEHARRLVGLFAGTSISAVYTSPLRRATETAAPLAAAHGLGATAVDDLRELDFGDLEGLLLDEVADRFPDLTGWTEAPSTVCFPGGETVAALRARALRASSEIIDRHAGETAVAVTHAVVIRAIVTSALGMPDDALFRIDQAYGGISTIDWFGERPLLRAVNAARI